MKTVKNAPCRFEVFDKDRCALRWHAIAAVRRYTKLPKDRIAHMHLKDVVDNGGGKTEWAAIGRGAIHFVGQFRALRRDGYTGAMSLETHWRGGGTPEESTRQSMAGLKALLLRAQQ